jgi:hypothetical protein
LIEANEAFSATLVVPEPSTIALLAIGAMTLCLTRRRRRERQVL